MKLKGLDKQYEKLKKSIDSSIQSVLEKQNFIMGPEVGELETRLADFIGTKYCVTCANGTDAIILALMALGIGVGDAVFLPDFTFIASANCVSLVGATPIFIDVDRNTFNISVTSLEETICNIVKQGHLRPKAVIAVDLFGLPANYPALNEIASRHNLSIIEDGAQGFGGSISNAMSCSFGCISTTSFFPVKPLGCYGDGGAVFLNDLGLKDLIVSLRSQGSVKGNKYENVVCGFNSRLDTIQAAILIPKLEAFKEYEFDSINNIAHRYTANLYGHVVVPEIPETYGSSWAQYTIVLENELSRNGLADYLKTNDVETAIYYPLPLHEQKAFRNTELWTYCANSEYLSQRVLSLPIHPYMTEDDVDLVSNLIVSYFRTR